MKLNDISLKNRQRKGWMDAKTIRAAELAEAGKSFSAIAAELGLTRGQVAGRLARMRSLDNLIKSLDEDARYGNTPTASDWEIGPNGTMVRTLRKRGGAVPLPMSTRRESNYSPTRGKPSHHCGPDSGWPHGFCEHYMKPNKCALVAGFIAARGGCDWYERAEAPQGSSQTTSRNGAEDHFPVHQG